MYLQSFLQPCKMAARTDNALEEIYPALIWLALVSSLQAQILNVDSCSGGPDGNLDAQTTVTARNLGNAPYATQISNQIYTPGSTITVTIIPLLDSARTYQELIIQARLASASVDTASTPVGSFTLVNDFTDLNCNTGVTRSTLVTTNSNSKTLPVTGITFTFQTPNPAVGAIQFVFTIVQQPTVFYERITSQAFDIASTGPGPIISSCPGNIVEPSDGSAGFIFVSWNEPTSTGIPDSNNEASPNGFFLVGNPTPTSLMYGYSTGGLRNECNFDILLPNIVNPIITSCPEVGSITVTNVNATQGQFNYNTPTCSEVGGGSVAVTCMPASGAVVDNTVNSISCTCSIAGNLQAFCTTNNIGGSVNDPPQIAPCPATAQVFTVGVNQAVYVYTTPTCTGPNGDFTSVTCNPASGTVTSVVQQITCTCTDTAGLTDACTISLPAINTPPTIVCPQIEGVPSLSGNIGNNVNWPLPSCTDQQDTTTMLSVTCSRQSGDFFVGTGIMQVLCTCTDTGSLSDQCTINVEIVAENIPPTIDNCPSSTITLQSQPNNAGADLVFSTPICTDSDQDVMPIVVCNPASGSFVQGIGSRTGTCTCTDLAGETSQCTFSIIINEANTPPVITCPPRVIAESLQGNIGNNAVWTDPTCTDTEQFDGSLVVSCNPASGFFFTGVGDNIVTCTCSDNGGEMDTCTFTVTIEQANTPPAIMCPGPVVIASPMNNNGNVADMVGVTCTDTGGDDATLTVTCTALSNLVFGDNIVNCECSDSTGLSDTCTITVTFEAPNTPPRITCPAPVTVQSLANNIGNNAFWADPTCTDLEQDDITLTTICNPMSGNFFSGVQSNSVSCTCTDNGGLSDTCAFTVTVETANTPPVITCPAPVTVESLANNVGNTASWADPTCTDLEQNDVALAISCNPVSGSFFSGVQSNSVTCTCTDNGGLSDTCAFTVTVETANTSPVITCPVPVTVQSLANNIGNNAFWTDPTCTDLEQDDITLTTNCSPMSGSFFSGVQSNSVSCTCMDDGGLSDTCVFTVTVETANTPPVITCPAPVRVQSLANNVGNTASWADPTCTDLEQNDVALAINCNPASGSFFSGVQSNSVTCTCTDNGGLSGTCVFTVTVETANTPPNAPDCPATGVTVTTVEGIDSAVVTYGPFTCNDAEQGFITATCIPVSGTAFSIGGNNVVTCTCTDNDDLLSTCTFFVNVVGSVNDPPQIAPCPATAQVFTVGVNQAVYVYTTPTCTDPNGDVTSVTCNPASGTVTFVVEQITCTCEDTAGSTDTCTISLPAGNTQPGPPNCPNTAVTVTTLGGSTSAVASYGPFVCSDFEQGSITATCNPVSGTSFSIAGNNVVTCTCRDNGGLQNSCNFFVNVLDENTAPNPPNCPTTPVSVTTIPGVTTAAATFGPFTCTDGEQGSILAQCDPVSGSQFSVGSNAVICTCTDDGGLQNACTFVVIVTESSQTSPIWFVLVPSAAFIFGMALLVSVILVLKRRKPKEKQRSDDTPMGVVTNTSRSAGMDEEGYIDPNIENKHSSDGGAKEYTGILPKHGKPETTTSIKTPSGKIYSRNIYDSEDYYFQPIE